MDDVLYRAGEPGGSDPPQTEREVKDRSFLSPVQGSHFTFVEGVEGTPSRRLSSV